MSFLIDPALLYAGGFAAVPSGPPGRALAATAFGTYPLWLRAGHRRGGRA